MSKVEHDRVEKKLDACGKHATNELQLRQRRYGTLARFQNTCSKQLDSGSFHLNTNTLAARESLHPWMAAHSTMPDSMLDSDVRGIGEEVRASHGKPPVTLKRMWEGSSRTCLILGCQKDDSESSAADGIGESSCAVFGVPWQPRASVSEIGERPALRLYAVSNQPLS